MLNITSVMWMKEEWEFWGMFLGKLHRNRKGQNFLKLYPF
tara:strand:+ start:306 stop:425 length:120 start_codon:yes stop_codon:yes gene_type:complete